MAGHKGHGFLWAFIFAVVSFFVIFLFMPEKSEMFFGTSLSRKDARKVNKAVTEVTSDITDTVTETVVKSIKKK